MPLIATLHTSLDFDSAFLCKTIYCCFILLHLLVVCSCAIAPASPSSLFPGIPLILQGFPAPLPPKPITPCAYSQLGICPGSHLLPCAYAPCHPNAPPAILTPLKHTNSIFSHSQTASFSPQTNPSLLELGWIKMFCG